MLSINTNVAQTTKSDSVFQQQYEGTWRNKETKRSISISFDTETDYVTINKWSGKHNSKNIDAYKAYLKDNKLILYAENNDHHCNYCEMEIANNNFIYQCNNGLNFIDQFLNTTKGMNTQNDV